MQTIKKRPTKYQLEFGMTAEELMQLFLIMDMQDKTERLRQENLLHQNLLQTF